MLIPEATETEIQNRLDLLVMRAYGAGGNIRAERNRIIRDWRSDEILAPLALNREEGLSGISEKENQRAITNIADYWFEPIVLPTMSMGQARDYYLAAQNSFQLEIRPEGLTPDRPLVLETLHHCCIFSVLYIAIQRLVQEFGFRRIVLLHLREPLDPRLEICRTLTEHVLKAEAVSILLDDNWLSTLRHTVNDRTIVIYMGDMTPNVFPELQRPERAMNHVRLYAEPNIDIEVQSISMASILARHLKADHYSLDFPRTDVAELRPRNGAAPLSCPLPDWIFWPALRRWYDSTSPETARASAA